MRKRERGRTNGDSSHGVLVEHPEEKIPGGSLDLVGHFERSDLDLLEEDSDVVVVEGKSSREKSEEDDSARPDVGRSSVVGLSLIDTKTPNLASAQAHDEGKEPQEAKKKKNAKIGRTATISGLA